MTNKKLTKTSQMLLWAVAGFEVFSSVIITPQELKKRAARGNLFKSTNNMESFLYYLVKKGYIKYVDKNNERFIKLTKRGELAALLVKAKLPGGAGSWDGKWRVIIFDIPEASNKMRSSFRLMLKHSGFVRLQNSVYVSPNPLNRESVEYLRQTGLIDFIRILKVEEMDDDKDLKKRFGLK